MLEKPIYLDLLVIGSGLSSLNFIDKYLEKNNKINVVSPNLNLSSYKFDKKNNHIFKILPPQMLGKEKKVKAYFELNNMLIEKNCKMFGSLEFGGLSNYWGLQMHHNFEDDIKHLSKKTKKNINESFVELMEKIKLAGKFKYKSKLIDYSFIKKKFQFNKKKVINSKLNISEPILGFSNKKRNGDIENINEIKDKLTAHNFFNKNLKKKKIIFHNYYVKNIRNHSKGVELICMNNKKIKKFIVKKLVLGCGTIPTTKLIIDYFNIKKEVKLNHHPRLFTLFFLKKKWKNNMAFHPPFYHLKSKRNPNLFTTDFRPGNSLIINSIIKFKKYLYPVKFILNIIRFNMLFLNTFLHPKYGNIFLKLNNDKSVKIYSKEKNLKKIFDKTSSSVYKFFRSMNKIFPFQLNYFPGFGADFHYFGTLKMRGKSKLSINENCQLIKNKKIFIIDGSVFNFKNNKFPLGIVLANARRVAKNLS